MSGPQDKPAFEPLTISEVIDLAWDYIEDGAFHSAARCLRAAADRVEKMAERRDRALGTTAELQQ